MELVLAYVPGFSVLATFTLAAVALTLTPGPDMTLFLGKAVSEGRASGLAAFFGAVTGLLLHTVLAAVGLSALLAASPDAFLVLKIVGAAYLAWLAWQALRHGSGLTLDPQAGATADVKGAFVAGLGINILNPKIVMFFVTFLPQFVSPDDPKAGGTLLFLGLYFIALAMPICVVMILMADRISQRVRRSPRLTRAIDYLFAGVMGGFAVKLLLAKAS
ncbi:MAG: LysE family translocator [Pseudomonadota bacterium]